MECELCGRRGSLVNTEVEGTVLSVCSSCARLGTHREVVTEIKDKRHMNFDLSSINPDFSRIIKNARTSQNITLDQLASALNEKISVLDRVEKGMRPTDILAKKLEKTLKIKLLGFQEL